MKQHDGFIKNSDVNVLLAGGGHKPLSDFLLKSSTANQVLFSNGATRPITDFMLASDAYTKTEADNKYVKKAGDSMGGSLHLLYEYPLLLFNITSDWGGSIGYENHANDSLTFSLTNQRSTFNFKSGRVFDATKDWLDNTVTPDFRIGNSNGSSPYAMVGSNYVIHTGNIGSYAPSLTGTGASGTWPINITGVALFSLRGIQSRFLFMCACYATNSYTAYKLTTNWHKSWNIMPCISIRGYNYGNGQNIDTDIVMYHYDNSVYSASYINRGSCNIRVFHQFENNVSVFYIDPGMYFGMFNVFMYGGMGTDSIASGWTMEPVGAMAGSELSHNHIANGISTNMACYAGSWNSSSDINKKFNIKSISNILPLYEFNWKDTGKKSYGVIAQYLEKLGHSEFVTDSEFGKTVNYSEVLTYFLAKLSNIVIEKDLATNSRINLLEKRILELENKINTN